MATRSTPATKRTATKKPAAAPKKTAAKKPAPKKPLAKKATVAHRHPAFSFRVTSEDTPFLTFRVTRQSLYWFIFSIAILALGGWNLYLNMRVMEIYDQIDQNSVTIDSLSTDAKRS